MEAMTYDLSIIFKIIIKPKNVNNSLKMAIVPMEVDANFNTESPQIILILNSLIKKPLMN